MTDVNKESTIDDMWERSEHGTSRQSIVEAYEAGVAAERERCAKLCEAVNAGNNYKNSPLGCARAIREQDV